MRSANESVDHARSSSVRSAVSTKRIPSLSSAGRSSSEKSRSMRAEVAVTRLRISASCSSGRIPSGVVAMTPASTCSNRPETRTWKNSSRLCEQIARNFTLARIGRSSSSASARTRSLKSSQDSSRLRYREAGSAGEVGMGSASIAPMLPVVSVRVFPR